MSKAVLALNARNAQSVAAPAVRLFGAAEGAEEVARVDAVVSVLLDRPSERVVFDPRVAPDPFAPFFAALRLLGPSGDAVPWVPTGIEGLIARPEVGENLDLPGETTIRFRPSAGALDLVVFSANSTDLRAIDDAVLSIVLELAAFARGLSVGSLVHVRNGWTAPATALVATSAAMNNPYEDGFVEPFPLVARSIAAWRSDLWMFVAEGDRAMGYQEPWFRKVGIPLLRTWQAIASGDLRDAFVHSERIAASDLAWAVRAFIDRRKLAL
jgi:hypothetical protein